jgi:K+-dependent Na+/Ca+ exchanger-like protein
MLILGSILGLLLTFYLLAKICEDYFVESLELIARRFRMPHDVAGATLMAVGSSAPELFTSLIAVHKIGAESIGVGTIVGSAIFNILVIVGGVALVATVRLDARPVIRDLGFYLASVLLLFWVFEDGVISKMEAITCLLVYAVYILFLVYWSRRFPFDGEDTFLTEEAHQSATRRRSINQTVWKRAHEIFTTIVDQGLHHAFLRLKRHSHRYPAVFTISIVYIAVLSWVLVELSVVLAHELHVSEAIIALTVLAIGTSVPDMMASLIVSRKGKGGMAVSNAIGSNTFDILIGLGLPWSIYILWNDQPVTVATHDLLGSIMLLGGSVVLLALIFAVRQFTIGWKAGIFLLFIYAVYLLYAILSASAIL